VFAELAAELERVAPSSVSEAAPSA